MEVLNPPFTGFETNHPWNFYQTNMAANNFDSHPSSYVPYNFETEEKVTRKPKRKHDEDEIMENYYSIDDLRPNKKFQTEIFLQPRVESPLSEGEEEEEEEELEPIDVESSVPLNYGQIIPYKSPKTILLDPLEKRNANFMRQFFLKARDKVQIEEIKEGDNTLNHLAIITRQPKIVEAEEPEDDIDTTAIPERAFGIPIRYEEEEEINRSPRVQEITSDDEAFLKPSDELLQDDIIEGMQHMEMD